jgi:hypothetical protein
MVMVAKWTGQLVHRRGLHLEHFMIMVHESAPSTKVASVESTCVCSAPWIRCGGQREDRKVSIASRLSPIEVLDLEGRSVALGSYWKEKPVVLVFIRHFG